MIFERLDDQLFFAHQAIHSQAEAAPARANHDYENAFGRLFTACAAQAIQPNERENLLAQLKDFVVVHAMNVFVR